MRVGKSVPVCEKPTVLYHHLREYMTLYMVIIYPFLDCTTNSKNIYYAHKFFKIFENFKKRIYGHTNIWS